MRDTAAGRRAYRRSVKPIVSSVDDDRRMGGLPKTIVNLFLTPKINNTPYAMGPEGLLIFDDFRISPEGNYLIYRKGEHEYWIGTGDTDGSFSMLRKYDRRPSLSKLTKATREFLLDKRTHENKVDIITYPQAEQTIRELCDSVLNLAPSSGFDTGQGSTPHYTMGIAGKL